MNEAAPRPSLWKRWVVQPIVQQLTQGTSPPKIAQAVSYPIIGSTTLLSLLVGVPMKLNQPVLQAFKTLAYPLQWSLVLGFYRVGEMLYGAPHVSLSIPKMIERFFAEPGPFFRDYGMTALYGITVWCLIAPLLIFLLYVSTRPLIQGMADQIQRRRHAPL
jgi:uncharacterized protein (DUF2062 family)